jgi:predicted esterase
MKLVGLNGTTVWPLSNGRISQYFTEGYFPFQWTYRKQAWRKMLKLMPNEPYIITGFSAGATLCHQIVHTDPFCEGAMIHSGQFRRPTKLRPHVPILLLRTEGDIFNTYVETTQAFDYYRHKHYSNTSLVTLESTRWHGHQYSNGLERMRQWCEIYFNFKLPLK